jgi:hypothetical protein
MPQKRELLLGQVELVFETPIVRGGEVRAPHQAPGPEDINELREERIFPLSLIPRLVLTGSGEERCLSLSPNPAVA